MDRSGLSLEMLQTNEIKIIVTPTSTELRKNIFPATTRSDLIKFFGVIILITDYKFSS